MTEPKKTGTPAAQLVQWIDDLMAIAPGTRAEFQSLIEDALRAERERVIEIVRESVSANAFNDFENELKKYGGY